MENTEIRILNKPKLKNPILVEGLPGIGNVGRVSVGYMISELKAKKFAEMHSPHFLPLVVLDNNSNTRLLKGEFFYVKASKGKKGKSKRDIIFLTGDSQSISPNGHYEICGKILDFAEKFGVKEIITIGGYATGKQPEKPRVIAAVNSPKLMKKYKDLDFQKDHKIGTIVGASGLLIGLGEARGMEGLCLMGETMGFPIVITDPKSAESVLDIVLKILGVRIDMNRLEKSVKDMEESIKKTEEIHRSMMVPMKPQKEKESTQYIG